jgi:hypothetical protein
MSCRCINCDEFVTLHEEYRPISDEEKALYPHVRRQVAKATCPSCDRECLAIEPETKIV